MKLNKKLYWEVKDDGKLKTSELLDLCRKQFKVYSWYEDKKLDADFPPVKSTRYFKKNVEADEDLKNLSADDLKEKGIEGITIRERIILELNYFKETGKHLDIENWTLCSGSRFAGGRVPFAYWGDDEFYVRWTSLDDRDSHLRSRVCINIDKVIESKDEKDKSKQGFCITCEQCGLSITIKS